MRGGDEQQLDVSRQAIRCGRCETLPRRHCTRCDLGLTVRALLLQVLYSVRSERMLMEQLDYNLLFRSFVGLNMDDAIWNATVFTKNRQRLLDGDVADAFFAAVLKQARQRDLLSDEHFTVDGTLSSFRRLWDGAERPPSV